MKGTETAISEGERLSSRDKLVTILFWSSLPLININFRTNSCKWGNKSLVKPDREVHETFGL